MCSSHTLGGQNTKRWRYCELRIIQGSLEIIREFRNSCISISGDDLELMMLRIWDLTQSYIICCVLDGGLHVLIWVKCRRQNNEICALYLVSNGNRTVLCLEQSLIYMT